MDKTYTLFSSDKAQVNGSFIFSFCSKPSETKQVWLVSDSTKCREILAYYFIQYIRYSFGEIKITENIDHQRMQLDCTRLVITTKYISDSTKQANCDTFERAVIRGVKLVNLFTSHHGWRQTKLYGFQPQESISSFMTVGDKRWLKSTHMLSMYTLMLRLGVELDDDDVKTLEKALSVLKEPSTLVNRMHAYESVKYWNMIMHNFDELFCGLDERYIYSTLTLDRQHDEGITKLCIGSSAHKFIANVFEKLKHRYLTR